MKGLVSIKTIVEKESRVEELRERLLYPIKKRDPQGSDFWYLHPGESEANAKETAPIAIGFFSELNDLTDEREIQRLLTSKEWQKRIYGHYLSRTSEQQPVMYLLLPTEDGVGRVPLVLPTEGGLKQRNIQTFAWGSPELETRLNRLRQGELPIALKALISIPLVERAFYQPIKTAKDLAHLLAEAARRIEQIIPKVYKSEEHRYPASQGNEGYLHKLLKSFQDELLPSLRLASENEKDYSFSDIYAQTIAYSLFTARVFSYVQDQRQGKLKETLFDRESAWQQLPETNPFLRRLFQDVSERSSDELGDELIGAIAEIFTILRAAKMDVILQDFREKQNREDIVIRFYEDFLAAYKPEMRERRGVYYTPEPVVSYMVKSVDVLLKEKFNKPLGLADPEVMILDPACGTGTFLLKICQIIHDRFHAEREAIVARVGDISWSEYVSTHLLPRIFGFELLMAPYAIAHLKLGLFLEETGYQFDGNKRLGVYLTNALDDAVKKSEIILEEFIANEANEAAELKRDTSVMVVVGNPPYSVSSSNKGNWILDILKDYKQNLNEKKINLDDDYIKFIRFAQYKIEKTGHGILGFITNHSYISGLTHRQMRKSLHHTFDNIQILDLHGNSLMQEKSPDGFADENIFDIRQGVGIFLGCKIQEQNQEKVSRVFFSEMYGRRETKYELLNAGQVDKTDWTELNPKESKFFFFCPKDFSVGDEYNTGISISEKVFLSFRAGIQTKRDGLVYHFTSEELRETTQNIKELSVEEIRDRYNLPEDGRDWSVGNAKNDLLKNNPTQIQVNYHPFDFRWASYTGKTKGLMAYPRHELMSSMLKPNLALLLVRNSRRGTVDNFFVTDKPLDKDAISSFDNVTFFPLYTYSLPTNGAQKTLIPQSKEVNFSRDFLSMVRENLGYTPTPEAIFYYIYAIFHSPTYRGRYAEFLKIDFPRIPLTRNDTLFRQLAAYGEELVALHLMKSDKLIQTHQHPQFVEQGGNCIVDPAHPKYEINNRSVVINKKGDRFTDIPQAVWNFYVGGYPVCAKWLKDRKGRTLSPQDITHYQQIVVALDETIKLMTAIDQAIPGFPIE